MPLCRFVEDYKIFTERSETPESMHVWCAFSALAGAAEKRLWLDRGLFRLYLNLYIALVAPPGVCAKSTTLGLVVGLLEEVGVNVFEDAVTKEEILKEMCELERVFEYDKDGRFFHSSITYVASELNVLLSTGSDMIKFLVNIWDKDKRYVYRTKNSGIYEVRYPFFNLLGAVVPDWFGNNVLADINSTGFLARLIMVYEDKKRKKEPFPQLTPEAIEARKRCVATLTWLTNQFGEVVLTKEAEEYYREWYMQQDIDTSQDSRFVSYLERKVKTHVLKLSALNALGDRRREVTEDDIDAAIRLLAPLEPKIKALLFMASENKLAKHVVRLKSLIEAQIEIPFSDLVSMFYSDLTKDQFLEVLQIVQDLGIAKVEVKHGARILKRVGIGTQNS